MFIINIRVNLFKAHQKTIWEQCNSSWKVRCNELFFDTIRHIYIIFIIWYPKLIFFFSSQPFTCSNLTIIFLLFFLKKNKPYKKSERTSPQNVGPLNPMVHLRSMLYEYKPIGQVQKRQENLAGKWRNLIILAGLFILHGPKYLN